MLSLVDKGATTRSVMLSEAGVTAAVPQWLHCTLILVQCVELSGHGTALPGPTPPVDAFSIHTSMKCK